MSSYQQPDFNSAKMLAVCQRYKISTIRMIVPMMDRNYRPDHALDLLVEFSNSRKVTSTDLLYIKNDLVRVLERDVKVQNLEEMTRHARVTAIADSKVVFA